MMITILIILITTINNNTHIYTITYTIRYTVCQNLALKGRSLYDKDDSHVSKYRLFPMEKPSFHRQIINLKRPSIPHNVGPPLRRNCVQLVYITPISLWFMIRK